MSNEKRNNSDSGDKSLMDDFKLEIWNPIFIEMLEKKYDLPEPVDEDDIKALEDAIKSGCYALSEPEIRGVRKYLEYANYYCEVVVLSIDIRNSSIVLNNVEDFAEFSKAFTDFICYVTNSWKSKKGRLFDKFTGDGVLGFWALPVNPEEIGIDEIQSNKALVRSHFTEWNLRIKDTINFAIDIICKFMSIALPNIRKTCALIPKGYGLSVGIDAGECLLTELRSSSQKDYPREWFTEQYGDIKGANKGYIQVSNNLTMIGRPVIGATRMVSVAKAHEILVNCYPGAALKAIIKDPTEHKIHEDLYFDLDLVFRKVKEYCYGPVEAYRVNTDRIEGLKKELGLVEEDKESSTKKEKGSEETICDKEKKDN